MKECFCKEYDFSFEMKILELQFTYNAVITIAVFDWRKKRNVFGHLVVS